MRSRWPQCKALAVAPGATCATAKTRKKRSTPMRACFVQIEWPISGRELASEYDPTACRSHRHIFRCLFSFASFQRSHLPCHLNQCLPVWGSSRKERILFSAVQSKRHCFAVFFYQKLHQFRSGFAWQLWHILSFEKNALPPDD